MDNAEFKKNLDEIWQYLAKTLREEDGPKDVHERFVAAIYLKHGMEGVEKALQIGMEELQDMQRRGDFAAYREAKEAQKLISRNEWPDDLK